MAAMAAAAAEVAATKPLTLSGARPVHLAVLVSYGFLDLGVML
jgi:hypothetical protein